MVLLIKGISDDFRPAGVVKNIGDFIIKTRGYLTVFRDIVLSNELFTCDYQLADKAREKLNT
ncbi:MAG: hypothetical protein ACOX23_04190 [Peptococcia bacterium]